MRTVRDATFDVFRQFGLTTLFANPGSTEISFLTDLPDDLEFVLALHEGSVVGIAAGVFALMGLAMLMHGIAWLLNDLFFSGNVWAGFLIEAAFWFGVAAAAGFFAFRAVRAGAPPTPDLAIEEARRTKETLEAGAR